ncbi:MAG: aspartyl protease family protein [Tepidiformaceae bacterium]
MKASTVYLEPRSETNVGRVTTALRIINRVDQALAARGDIDPEQVRSVSLQDVLVDTGATLLCLPADLIARLGLEPLRDARIMTANGPVRARVFQDAKLELLGRAGTFDCLELPEGVPPLLGVVPLEVLGLEPDLAREQLRVLSDEGDHPYLLAL